MMINTFLVAATFVLATQVLADQQVVDETKPAQADGFVHINIVRGDLVVEGWDRDEIRVSGELDEETREFVFEVNGNDARIEVRGPSSNSSWWGEDATDLSVSVPAGSNVDISVVSTDVDVSNIAGGLEVGGVSGDLLIDNIANRVDLKTVSGDVDLRDSQGRIQVRTVSGDLDAYDTRGQSVYHTVSGDLLIDNGGKDLELESVSGDLEVLNTEYLSIRGHSISGDVEIAGQLLSAGAVEFDTVSGTVRLGTGGSTDTSFDLETGSGSIRNRLTDHKPDTAKYARSEHLRFVVGEGKSEVIITTRSGDIILGR